MAGWNLLTLKLDDDDGFVSIKIECFCCEAQARVRQGSARVGSQGKRPKSLNPSLELTLNLVDPPSFPPPPEVSLHLANGQTEAR